MPPKTRFSREEIIDAAFNIAREKGFDQITARNVAGKLGSSVAPIYVNFENIDQLVEAVVKKVILISQELLSKQKEKDMFAKIGKASLEFARDYPVFLRELTLKPNPYSQSYSSMEEALIEEMGKEGEMSKWTVEERKEIFFKMRAFQLGLVVMVANDQIPSWFEEEKLGELLMETGKDLERIQKIKREEKNK